MATAGDGRAPYESSGAGGKFRKRPFRRSAQATPYDRPPTALRNNNPGLLTKLVDPASKLIYAGAHKLFGAFRKRLPSLSLQGPSEINEGPQKVSQGAGQNNSIGVSKPSIDQDGNSASISAATGISDLEQMLKQKTFTRSEIQHLTSLLHSRTTESPSDNIAERNEANPSSASPFLRREASTSGSMKKHTHAAISTPIVSSKVLEKETPSPAELAKAYMGTKPTKISPSPLGFTSHDSKMINNTTTLQKTPITQKTPNNFKGLENGFLTPRSRGRSAMYSMARATYTRSPSNFSQKGIMSDYSHGAMTSSQSLKRRSSVLEDDFGTGGPLRRTRQKPNLLSQSREKRELGYTTFQQQLLLKNEPEEKEDTSMHESTHVSVPEKSTQTATKIFQQLERLSPKSPTKLTSNMLHGQALRSLEKVDSPKFLPTSSNDTQKLEVQKHDNGESSSRGKEKVEENGAKKFPVPFNRLTAVNGDVGVSLKESAQIVMFDDSNSKLSSEPPQKKRAFQMSAPEDTWELDDDDDDVIHVNGHVSFPVIENNKPETSSVSNKSVSADIIEPPTPPEISKAPAPVEATPVVVPEVAKVPDPVELKEPEKAKSPPKTDGVFGGNVIEKETGFKFPTSQTSVLSQSTLQKDKVTPTEKASPFQFSSNEVSEFKPKEISDPKSVDSTSVFSSDTKGENGNISAASAMFSFTSSATPDSSPSIFSSSTFFPSSGGNTSSPFNNTSSHIAPASASVSTTSVFSSSSPTIPMAESSKTDAAVEKEPQSTISSSFFATTTTTTPGGGVLFGSSSSAATSTTTANGGALFGFSSPAATSTVATTTTNGGALFGFSSPAATSTTANGGAPFGFGSSAATSTTTNGGALFGFSAPAATSTSTAATNGGALFGFSAPAATSTTTAAATGGGAVFGFSAPAATSTTIAATSGGALFGFSAPAATSTTTTTTTGSALFGFSSPAATSTTTAQSQPSFFNATTGSQATTQPPSTAATQSVPFQFGSGSSSSVFGSSAPSFTSSPTFGMSSIAATTEGKSGNSTSGPTTTVFGSSWQPQNSSSVFSFGASSSATSTPITFGASNTNSSSMFSFSSSGPANPSFTTPSQVFGTPNPVFANNNNDQMSMEDSMAEDSMQAASPNPVSPFGQAAPVAAPGFMFGSAAAPPPQPAAVPFQFGGQPTQPPPAQNPFQSSSVEFNGGGGSFSLGSGGDKSGRRIVRVNKSKNRRK